MRPWQWTAAALGVLAVVVMPAGVAWAIWSRLPVPKDMSVFGAAFSDVVSPLFAALAFAGLIYTALMQREELSLQRQELEATRAELKGQREAQEGSEKALQAQVATAKLAARLNASTALFTYHRGEMDKIVNRVPNARDENAFDYHQRQSFTLIERIEDVLKAEEVEASAE